MTKSPKSTPSEPFTSPPPGYLERETRRIAAKYFRLRSGQVSDAEKQNLRDEIAEDERDLAYVKERIAEQ
jgi:hypothetical protein